MYFKYYLFVVSAIFSGTAYALALPENSPEDQVATQIGNLSAIARIVPNWIACPSLNFVTDETVPESNNENPIIFEENIRLAIQRVQTLYLYARLFSIVAYPQAKVIPTQGKDFRSIRLTFEWTDEYRRIKTIYIQSTSKWGEWFEPEFDTSPRGPDYAIFDFSAMHTSAFQAIRLMRNRYYDGSFTFLQIMRPPDSVQGPIKQDFFWFFQTNQPPYAVIVTDVSRDVIEIPDPPPGVASPTINCQVQEVTAF